MILQFIKNVTDIPVPRVLEAYEEDGSFHLWTELIHGATMAELLTSNQVMIERHPKTFHDLVEQKISTSQS